MPELMVNQVLGYVTATHINAGESPCHPVPRPQEIVSWFSGVEPLRRLTSRLDMLVTEMIQLRPWQKLIIPVMTF